MQSVPERNIHPCLTNYVEKYFHLTFNLYTSYRFILEVLDVYMHDILRAIIDIRYGVLLFFFPLCSLITKLQYRTCSILRPILKSSYSTFVIKKYFSFNRIIIIYSSGMSQFKIFFASLIFFR